MKKHLFTLTALALAILFSAFSKPKLAQTQSFETLDLVWYPVNGSGQTNINNPINPGNPMTAQELLETYYPLCDLGDDADCVRGFYAHSAPTSSSDAGVEQIRKDL